MTREGGGRVKEAKDARDGRDGCGGASVVRPRYSTRGVCCGGWWGGSRRGNPSGPALPSAAQPNPTQPGKECLKGVGCWRCGRGTIEKLKEAGGVCVCVCFFLGCQFASQVAQVQAEEEGASRPGLVCLSVCASVPGECRLLVLCSALDSTRDQR